MKIEKDKVVSFHYRLTDIDGNLLEESFSGQPLSYLHGHGNLIPGMENALDGREAGDKFDVTIEPKDAYGEHHPGLVQRVPREAFQGVDDIQVGMRFRASTGQGEVPVVVTEVSDTEVVVDGNHPLAGKTLKFDVEVTDVRDATAEELAHGHAHGPEGHGH
ncbi:MAG: peptidylprolyl isomerase [Gammaproteobacteria bacterium]|nr:MAG: peptidylprolyl isomerase [Gammaproteobacteria bacterium]